MIMKYHISDARFSMDLMERNNQQHFTTGK